jgi:hypothetical protein
MNFLEAQRDLAESIVSAGSKLEAYFWRLSGDEPNSLCRFLCMEEEELKVVLRLCKIYTGEKDNFSKNNFDFLLSQCGCERTTFRLEGKLERFIMIGHGGDVVIPKDMYDGNGKLSYYPVKDVHVQNVRTKSQRGSLPKLLHVGQQQAREADIASKLPSRTKKSKEHLESASPSSMLFDHVAELVAEAGKTANGKMTPRAS